MLKHLGKLGKWNLSSVGIVGANGFGCELLIDLALSGFQNLMVIGIDWIEVINQAEKNPVPFFF